MNSIEIRKLIQERNDSLLMDPITREMFELVLLAPTFETVFGELSSENTSATFFPLVRDKTVLVSNAVRITSKPLLEEKPTSITQFQALKSGISLDLQNGSPFCKALFSTLNSVSDESLRDKFRPLIYLKWSMLLPIARIYFFFYWALTILSYIYFGFQTGLQGLGITVCVMSGLFLLLEIKCIFSDFKLYISNLWDYIDLFIFCFTIATTIVVLTFDGTNYNVTAIVWIRMLAVVFLGVRCFTWLRIINSTRYLITMVLQVFQDVFPFLLVLATIMSIVSYVWRLTPVLQTTNGQELSFYESVQFTFGIIFGNVPEQDEANSEFPVIRFIILIAIFAVLALTLLNFLIALISGTFERVSNDKEIYDVRELLSLIRELDIMMTSMPTRRCEDIILMLIPEEKKQDEILSGILESVQAITRTESPSKRANNT
jgi:hypothetical protein